MEKYRASVKFKILAILKISILIIVVCITNSNSFSRINLLIEDKRFVTLTIFLGIWAISLIALFVMSFHRSVIIRALWAVVIGFSSAASFCYSQVQGSEFFIFDVISLWNARHEVGRAADFYSAAIVPSLGIFAIACFAVLMPSELVFPGGSWRSLALFPALPIILIAGVVLYREGKGSDGLPKQFSPVSLALLSAYKINFHSVPERKNVHIAPRSPMANSIVMIIDESIRADFFSVEPGNPFTPEFAAHADRWIDFGPAISAGNCSNISNALLRFMATKENVIQTAQSSPTLWQYAKAAGYRTVYIDAQAGFIGVYGKLQNYMTAHETFWIDQIHKLDKDIPTPTLDDELLKIVLQELSVGDRVFIYANKNGAHFPYEDNVPEDYSVAMPSKLPSSIQDASLIPGYIKAVRWSTDRIMAQLSRNMPWNKTAVVYTSDHGQHFASGRLTHCSSHTNVDEHEAIVPLLVATDIRPLEDRLKQTALSFPDRASHFAIAPALLEIMGYAKEDISAIYGRYSLLDKLDAEPVFVSGDITGLFGTEASLHKARPALQRP